MQDVTLQIPDASTSILLSAMDVADHRALFAQARRKTYRAGQTIFVEGEPGLDVILITAGRAEVSVMSASGRKSVIAQMGPGEVLGEIAALDGGPRSASVVAVSDIEGLVLARSNIMAFVAERPDVARAVIAELCRKVRNASEMFVTRSIVEGGPRLARALLRLFDKWGTPGDGALVLTQRFSQSEIGEFSGLARENVNRYVKAWTEQSILGQKEGALVLLDRARLEDLAES